MSNELLKRWCGNEDAKQAWAHFMMTPAFHEGLRVLESLQKPFVAPNESVFTTAKRQSYQAGHFDCLDLMQGLPDITEKAQEETKAPWDHIENENELDDEQQAKLSRLLDEPDPQARQPSL